MLAPERFSGCHRNGIVTCFALLMLKMLENSAWLSFRRPAHRVNTRIAG